MSLVLAAARFQAIAARSLIAAEYRRNQIAIKFLDNSPYICPNDLERTGGCKNMAITKEQILAAEAHTIAICQAVFIFAAPTSTVVWQLYLTSGLVALLSIFMGHPWIWKNSINYTGPWLLGVVIIFVIGKLIIGG